jgi:phosphatidylinositol glycan class T
MIFSPDERHVALTHALSGLFCASLGQSLTNTFTTRPYIPHLVSATGSSSTHRSNSFLRLQLTIGRLLLPETSPYHTTSPPSGLCTENLTPFLKLLPSKGKSGLSGLLKSHRVLAGQWSSMKVKVWTEKEEVKIEMGFEIVWDLIGRQKEGSRARGTCRDLRNEDARVLS